MPGSALGDEGLGLVLGLECSGFGGFPPKLFGTLALPSVMGGQSLWGGLYFDDGVPLLQGLCFPCEL